MRAMHIEQMNDVVADGSKNVVKTWVDIFGMFSGIININLEKRHGHRPADIMSDLLAKNHN